jgi:hypothetical protein
MGELSQRRFDPRTFEAEVAMKLISSEQLPSVAQDAMEAGYDGPAVVRMAILEAKAGWAIDQALPGMLAELGLSGIDVKDAALRLARERAQHIISGGENPLASLSYFYRLMLVADYPPELVELGHLEDNFEYGMDDPAGQRAMAVEALENLLDPELAEERRAEAEAKWRKQQQEAERDWPYVFDSPGRRTLLHERFRKEVTYIRPLFAVGAISWISLAWALGSWRIGVYGFLGSIPLMFLFVYWGQYRRLKRERREILLRRRYPEDRI